MYDGADVDRPRHDRTPVTAQPGVLEHLLDHVGEAPAFVFDEIAVALRLPPVVHDAGRQVLRGGANHRERRPQFVRDRGDEVHLLRRQALRPARVDDNQRDARHQHAENPETQQQIAPPSLFDRGIE